MRTYQNIVYTLAFLAGLSLGSICFAQTKLDLGSFDINKDSRVELRSNSMVFNTETNITEFFDEVVVTYGGLVLTSDELRVEKNDSLEFYALGSLTISTGSSIIKGNKAHFDTKNQVAVVSGNVKVSNGENIISGDLLELNLKDGIAKIVGSVKTVFAPAGEASN